MNEELKYNFRIPIQIRMSDLDPFAHVNNGAQCNMFDFARGAYFEKVLNRRVDWLKVELVLVHSEFDYKEAIQSYDNIFCYVKVYHIGNKSLRMSQIIVDGESGNVKTICNCIISGYDRQTKGSMLIPDKYREGITKFED